MPFIFQAHLSLACLDRQHCFAFSLELGVIAVDDGGGNTVATSAGVRQGTFSPDTIMTSWNGDYFERLSSFVFMMRVCYHESIMSHLSSMRML